MKPAIAFPYHDPDGTLLPHVKSTLDDLKSHFDHAYVTADPASIELLRQNDLIIADDFFTLIPLDETKRVGEHFAYLYRQASAQAHPEQIIHLCFPDRFSFALGTHYRESFLQEIDSLTTNDLPLIFQRSPTAWDTHPQNYRQLEGIVTIVGKNLFDKEIDYAWCHLVVQAKRLREIMPFVTRPDISMVAEIALQLQEEAKIRKVDWLSWEDPFLLGKDSEAYKREREQSLDETNKRLNYVLPMIEILTKFSKNGRR